MPSLAFAAYTPTANHSWPTAYAVAEDGTVTGADAKYVKVIKNPIHTATTLKAAVVEETCMDPLCDDVREMTLADPDHTLVNTVMTPAEYTSAKVAQGEWTQASTAKWGYNNKCSITAKKCDCGYVGEYVSNTSHSQPSTVKTCDTSYVCTVCGKTVEKAGTHSHAAADAGVVVKEAAKCGYGEVKEFTCETCKQKYTEVTSAARTNCVPKKEVTPEIKTNGDCMLDGVKIATLTGSVGNWTGATPAPGYAVDISYTTPKFYVWDVVVTPAKGCGSNQTVGFTCKYCDQVIDSGDYENVGVASTNHDWETKEIPATCTEKVKEYKVCKTCGLYKTDGAPSYYFKDAKKTDKANSTPNGHKLVVNKIEATCSTPASYVIKCSECNAINTTVTAATFTDNGAKKGESLYVQADGTTVNFEKKTGSIELPYLEATTGAHKYTKKVVLREATCTDSEIQGYKCDDCGKILVHSTTSAYKPVETKAALDHDWKKVEIPATCGDYGKTLEQCSRCSLYKKGAGTTDDITKADSPNNLDAKPLVAPGAQHSFDKWVVTKASTVFEEGVKTLTCSVCGAHDATKTVIAKKTVAKASNTVTAGKKSLTVKSSAANATGYRVYYKKAGAKSWKSYTKKTTSLSKTFSGLSKGKYYVKVRAYAKNYDGNGEVVWGATSSTKSVKVK